MKDEDQTITIYNLRADTYEFIGASDAYIPAHTGLPAYCTDIEPPKNKEGFIAIFNVENNKWSLVEDHRGSTVYSTESGEPIIISDIGSLPDNTTKTCPDGQFKKWSNDKWVDDTEAEKNYKLSSNEQLKNSMVKIANERISTLQDAIDLDMATEQEKTELVEWKKYRVLLSRITVSDADMILPPTPQRV